MILSLCATQGSRLLVKWKIVCVDSFDETLTFERFFESVKRGDVLGVPPCIEWLHGPGHDVHQQQPCEKFDPAVDIKLENEMK